MRKFMRKLAGIIAVCLMLTAFPAARVQAENTDTGENYILADAFVSNFNNQNSTNYASNQTLIMGKGRHAYLRLDLSQFSAEDATQYVLSGSWAKGTRQAIVVTQSSEYLRENGADSTTVWTADNITYDNRPLDIGELNLRQEWSEGALEIDLTNFVKSELAKGNTTACLHLTTEQVDDSSVAAVEIKSGRHADGGPKLYAVQEKEPETPEYLNSIIDDSYVMSTSADTNYADKTTLIFGKHRHFYIRFDLSKIDAETESAIFKGTYNKGTRKTVVIAESGEYLRADEETESTEKWTTNNITYNNRPFDVEGGLSMQQEWPSSQTNLEIDLTDFLKAKKAEGAETACIHVTTTTVDDDSVSAVEIYSSRSDSGKPKLVISSAGDEKPVEVIREIDGDDYYDNGYIVQKVIKIRNEANEYLKVNAEDGTVTLTNSADDASLFGLHTYQYDKYEREGYGATKNTYAFEELSTGQYLTIQNYFSEGDVSKAYYNLENGRYIIKAGAPDVNWNERFSLEYYPESQYYTISSHLTVYRDSSDAVSPLYMDGDRLKCGGNDEEYKFYFEEAEGQDPLKVLQDVEGSTVRLYWKPVNQDMEPENYAVNGQTVQYDGERNELYTVIDSLEAGLHDFTVRHGEQQETVAVRIFNHLALAHSEASLDEMKLHVLNQEEPWYSDYQRLLTEVSDNMSDSSFVPVVHEGVGRGDPEGHGNMGDYEQSANAAYFNVLQWVITEEDQYAETTKNILNAWAENLKIVDGRDRILGASISTYRMNNAAEILRYYHGGYERYSDTEFANYQDMLLNVIYPVIQDLGLPMTANGNWDTAALAAMISVGAVCENTEIYERAVYLYQDIHTNGSIAVYVSDWGQSVESYRDQAHAQLGISYMAEVCEAAWQQGEDLWGLYDNRLAKAFNWAAQYNLYNTDGLRMEALTDVFGRTRWTTIDSEKINRGELRSVYELPLAHYSTVDGVDVTWMKKAAEAMRPAGWVNNDHLNFSTMTSYNGEATEKAEPYFQLRTRLEPWYQRTWNDVKAYGEVTDGVPETLNSYLTVSEEDGSITASSKKEDAPYYQLETQEDGSYAIRCVSMNTYFSVKDETVGNMNIIKADAAEVGENEKFLLKGTGASFFYLESPTFENRIVYLYVENENDPQNAVLTMYLGDKITHSSGEVSNNERFILVYNTADVALANIEIADTTALEKLINDLESKNIDGNSYKQESYEAYLNALSLAKQGVIDAKNGRIDQEAVDGFIKNLEEAYQAMIEAEEPGTEKPGTEKPGNTNSGQNNTDNSMKDDGKNSQTGDTNSSKNESGQKVVKTGDEQQLVQWAVLCLLGFFGMAFVAVRRFKKSSL